MLLGSFRGFAATVRTLSIALLLCWQDDLTIAISLVATDEESREFLRSIVVVTKVALIFYLARLACQDNYQPYQSLPGVSLLNLKNVRSFILAYPSFPSSLLKAVAACHEPWQQNRDSERSWKSEEPAARAGAALWTFPVTSPRVQSA